MNPAWGRTNRVRALGSCFTRTRHRGRLPPTVLLRMERSAHFLAPAIRAKRNERSEAQGLLLGRKEGAEASRLKPGVHRPFIRLP
jgi:hypothetical protein